MNSNPNNMETMAEMMKITCKSYRVRHQAEHLLLEVDEPEPSNVVPQLMSKLEVASRLSISPRKIEALASAGRLPVVRIDSCVRFREEDVLRLLNDQEPQLTVVPIHGNA
jgi:excisionase family DNA binding protein